MLAVTRDADVVTLMLSRPQLRNALDLEQVRAIRAAVDKAVEHAARVIVLTGEGTAFCSGADLNGAYSAAFLSELFSMLHHLGAVPTPIIAAVNGPAIGAGAMLAMACDLRVAHESAIFAVPTAKNGMAVDAWTVRRLSELAGGGRAARVMLAAATLRCDEALVCGLADRQGTLDDALDWAREIATLAPLALAHNKLILRGASDDTIRESYENVWASEDVREAALARQEKRPPLFTGR